MFVAWPILSDSRFHHWLLCLSHRGVTLHNCFFFFLQQQQTNSSVWEGNSIFLQLAFLVLRRPLPWALGGKGPGWGGTCCPSWSGCWCWWSEARGSWWSCHGDRCRSRQRRAIWWWCSWAPTAAGCHWCLRQRSAKATQTSLKFPSAQASIWGSHNSWSYFTS